MRSSVSSPRGEEARGVNLPRRGNAGKVVRRGTRCARRPTSHEQGMRVAREASSRRRSRAPKATVGRRQTPGTAAATVMARPGPGAPPQGEGGREGINERHFFSTDFLRLIINAHCLNQRAVRRALEGKFREKKSRGAKRTVVDGLKFVGPISGYKSKDFGVSLTTTVWESSFSLSLCHRR